VAQWIAHHQGVHLNHTFYAVYVVVSIAIFCHFYLIQGVFMQRFLWSLSALLLAGTTWAVPMQLSLPGVNLPAGDVHGARFNVLYGETSNVKGVNLSLGLSEMQNFTGVDVGLFFGVSHVKQNFKGLAINFVNWHEGQDRGVNMAFVNSANKVSGINFGGVNLNNGTDGLNWGGVNVVRGQSLVDIGIINYAERTHFQFGLINATHHLEGLQIGLVNYAANGILPILPLVNFNKSF
jgi:hypothetical protein